MTAQTDPTPAPGSIIAGKYVVERTIGVGGMGVVLAATHRALDQRVAIKCLLPALVAQQEVVARFLREGQAATKIRSEHVVRVLDVGELESGAPFMVLEYLEGKDLEDIVRTNGPLPVAHAVDYLAQALEALAEAHALGMVHRDLKPANLFLTHRADGSPCIKVLDFGISKVAARPGEGTNMGLTNAAAVMGSPQYMAPEQMRSARDVDARADIWALGAILHELIAGGPPFKGNTYPELFAQILQDNPPSFSTLRADVPAQLDQVVMKAMQKDPAGRFANVAELAFAIAPYGSPLARASAERIGRVLSVTAPANPGGVTAQRAALGSAATISVPPPSATDAGVAVGKSSHTLPPKKKGVSKAVIFGPSLAALIIGAAVVFGVSKMRSTDAPNAATSSSAPIASAAPGAQQGVASSASVAASATAPPADSPATFAATEPVPAQTSVAPQLPPPRNGRSKGGSAKGAAATNDTATNDTRGGAKPASATAQAQPAAQTGGAASPPPPATTQQPQAAPAASSTVAAAQPSPPANNNGNSSSNDPLRGVQRDLNNAGKDLNKGINKIFH